MGDIAKIDDFRGRRFKPKASHATESGFHIISQKNVFGAGCVFQCVADYDMVSGVDMEFCVDDKRGFLEAQAKLQRNAERVYVLIGTRRPVIDVRMELLDDGRKVRIRFNTKKWSYFWNRRYTSVTELLKVI